MRALVFFALLAPGTAEIDAAKCLGLGFGDSLACSTCDRLGAVSSLAASFEGDCRSCCHAPLVSSASFDHARLDVCQ
jgi:hypothetical protein